MLKRAERGVVSWLARSVLSCGVLSVLACGGGEDEPEVTFTKDIHPIFVARCGAVGCHNEPGFIQPGHGSTDVDVAYESATGTGSIGMPIYERIVARIGAADPRNMMPPNPPCAGVLGQPGCVTQAEFELIKAWVAEGHPK